jgi:hypothetical protein
MHVVILRSCILCKQSLDTVHLSFITAIMSAGPPRLLAAGKKSRRRLRGSCLLCHLPHCLQDGKAHNASLSLIQAPQKS